MSKHIRFDWAAKKMLRDKKNFGILEGFLSELLKEDIKIEGILESESNQEQQTDKFNRVDLLAENSKGELIIIEVQNTREWDYLRRMLYGTSKVVSEHMRIGDAYSSVKKVISVSIVYFEIGQGDDYVYAGKTKFLGLHTRTELQLTDKQQESIGKPTIEAAFPEYYLIRTTRFHDVINDTLDEWIYFFKNSEVLDSFRAKGIADVREKLAVMKMSDLEQRQYKRYLESLSDEASYIQTVKIDQVFAEREMKKLQEELEDKSRALEGKSRELEGKSRELEGKARELEGKSRELEGKSRELEAANLKIKQVVSKAIANGLSNELIAEMTGLSVEEVQAMRADR